MNWALIVAVSENHVIGQGGALPWRLPADLKFFKEFTLGKTVLMGRKTWDSLGRPLPLRHNVVLSHSPQTPMDGVEFFKGLDDFKASVSPQDPVVVIGGGQIYQKVLEQNLVSEMRITRVHVHCEGDAHFPILQPKTWKLEETIFRPKDEKNCFDVSFEKYQKVT